MYWFEHARLGDNASPHLTPRLPRDKGNELVLFHEALLPGHLGVKMPMNRRPEVSADTITQLSS